VNVKRSLPLALATLSVFTGLFLVTPAASSAQPSAHVNNTLTTTTTSLANNAAKTYRRALTAYRAARKEIAGTFKNAVLTAHNEYQAALSSATTGAQRSTARAAYALAITQAAAVRSVALTNLGSPPVRPN
jgi:hypothetical protein